MTIRIENLHVQNLGPISNFEMTFGALNLIYGHNETGKTYLVEFIIKSLFKNDRSWYLRHSNAQGLIHVSGLLEDEAVSFNPSSGNKLEDYLDESVTDLPHNINRLLVIKGGELSFTDNEPAGINKIILNKYLSNQEIVDKVQKNIPKVLQNSEIINGFIQGNNQGEIRNYNDLKNRIALIDNLFKDIEMQVSQVENAQLSQALAETERQIESLEKAKKHLAYSINKKLEALTIKADELPIKTIEQINETILKYRYELTNLTAKRNKYAELSQNCIHYPWLKSVIITYKDLLSTDGEKPGLLFPILAAVSLISGIGFIFFSTYQILSVFLILISFLFVGLYIIKQNQMLKHKVRLDEIRRISNEFRHKFNQEFTNIASLQTMLDKVEPDYYSAQTIKREIQENQQALEKLAINIKNSFFSLTGEQIPEKEWEYTINELKDQRNKLEQEINQLDKQLGILDINPADYQAKPADIDFNQEQYNDQVEKSNQIQNSINALDSTQSGLKQRICDITGDQITTPLQSLIFNLAKEQKSLINEYKELTAVIYAKILLNKNLEEIRSKEDLKIKQILKSNTMTDPLFKITNRYKTIEVVDDHLMVGDDYANYGLSDLSTATQEQVLLALRLGITSRMFNNKELFLILDDAFQHSDWDRREKMVNTIIELAKSNWQIIYFSMDDHIRDLISKKSKPVLKNDFKFACLDT